MHKLQGVPKKSSLRIGDRYKLAENTEYFWVDYHPEIEITYIPSGPYEEVYVTSFKRKSQWGNSICPVIRMKVSAVLKYYTRM